MWERKEQLTVPSGNIKSSVYYTIICSYNKRIQCTPFIRNKCSLFHNINCSYKRVHNVGNEGTIHCPFERHEVSRVLNNNMFL